MWLSKMTRGLLTATALLCLFLGIVGCGYHLEHPGFLYAHVPSVSVPVFANDTTYTYAGPTFSNAMIHEIMARTTTRIAGSKETSCKLAGRVKKITFSPAARNEGETVFQKRITVWIDMELTDDTGHIIWAVTDMTADQDYSRVRQYTNGMATTNIQAEEASIRKAMESIAQRIAQKAVQAMKNNF